LYRDKSVIFLNTSLQCSSDYDLLCIVVTIRMSCDDDEERGSRKVLKGCTRAASCTGCMKCVCFGCKMCRFTDCGCQTCVDFYRNSKE
jgi:hypothetical protein